MSDQRSATIRAVPFTDLFRSRAPTPETPQDREARTAAAAAKAFAAGEAAARSTATQTLAAQAATHDRALTEIQARHATAIAALQSTNEQALEAIEAALAESLASIAIAIARRLTASEPTITAETLQSLLQEALAALPEGAAGTLCLPPGAPRPTPPPGWLIVEDSTLPPCTLRARADASVVTASLDRRLAQLAAQLAGPPA